MNQVMNQRTAGVIDPILSTYARGYRNMALKASVLFPIASIPNRSMKQIKFGKQSFRLMNTRRAPGADRKRVQYGYAADPVQLYQDSLEGVVPVEHQQEAEKIPGIDMGQGAVNMVLDIVDLGTEVTAATIARNAASYGANNKLTLAGADRWSDPTADAKGDMDAAKEAIRQMIGRYPNTLLLSPSAFRGLKNNNAIKEQFKYTSAKSITLDMLAAYFELERVEVAAGVYLPDTADDDTPATDIWGDDAILAYVPTAGDNYQVPSYGYTYTLMGYPMVEAPYYERRNSSWIYPTTVERAPLLVGADAGFLFTNAGATG